MYWLLWFVEILQKVNLPQFKCKNDKMRLFVSCCLSDQALDEDSLSLSLKLLDDTIINCIIPKVGPKLKFPKYFRELVSG